jgi:hypothetical protein
MNRGVNQCVRVLIIVAARMSETLHCESVELVLTTVG